jgi:conjugative relaxase-like TrwC/TraI family protein
MLATKAQFSLSNAEEYFKEHLQIGDYYMEGRHVMGQWIGQGAESLGLSGVTHTDEFLNLCRNLHPTTGERLTQRHNETRMEMEKDGSTHKVANRRVFFDYTFSPPKSVSIAALVGEGQVDEPEEDVGGTNYRAFGQPKSLARTVPKMDINR